MTVIGGMLSIVWLFLIPLCIGAIPATFVDKKQYSPSFMWTSGYILEWAVFQVICVPIILMEDMGERYFPYVVYSFGTVSVLLGIEGIVLWLCKARKTPREKSRTTKKELVFWIVFGVLLAIQLVASVTMHYADGDDAFYVAVANLTESSETMYKLSPYDSGAMELSTRYGLAPFPIWLAFLARVTGISTVIMAHTVLATVLILLTYVIYGQIAELLFSEKKELKPIFLSLMALLIIFGNYSIYTVENFLIARSRQGKAALGNVIIPMVITLFLILFRRIQEEKKTEKSLWILLAATVTAACLCSTLGTFLMCLFLGIIGLCAGVVYRKMGFVVKTAVCCIPALVYALLYFWLG